MRKIIGICIIAVIIMVSGIILIFGFYPKKYKEEISLYADKYNIDRYLVASVINIESGYDRYAVSSVGAVGLMQVLPTTAQDVAGRLKINIQEEDLYEPKINIELGVFYLSYLMDMFDYNIINVLCAYNWGLQNVKDWIAEGNIDNNGTIINIPVNETKNYIKKFRLNSFVYRDIYKY